MGDRRRKPSDPSAGVVVPETDGVRSTSAFGRQVLSTALAGVDQIGAQAAADEPAWRSNYVAHLRRAVEAGLPSAAAAETIAAQGLAAASGMRWLTVDGAELSLSEAVAAPPRPEVHTERYQGNGRRVLELSIPVNGRNVAGAELRRLLDEWTRSGYLEPSAAAAVAKVQAHPEWLSLPDKTVVALGVAAEVGPTAHLLRWGATVAGVDLPRPEIWQPTLRFTESTGGTLLFPASAGMEAPARRAGLDVLRELPTVGHWLRQLPGALILGNYLYADGAQNLRACAAADALGEHLVSERDDVMLAGLATPTDVFAVPGAAVEQSVTRYANRALLSRAGGAVLGRASRGRLLRPAYRPGVDPGICDALVVQQGPNYALGKRLQRWRATSERAAGRRTSLLVAPPTRTKSVVKNRALAAAYAGAHRFGVMVFDPQTTGALMAALLVHDTYAESALRTELHPWQAEADLAVHGGLWRTPYAPRSALGLAALLGVSRTR